jgi:hypothetical protein
MDSGDLDGDGYADVVVANRASDSVSAFLNHGDGTLATRHDSDAGMTPVDVAIANLGGDPGPELVVVNAEANAVTVLDGTASAALFRLDRSYVVGVDPQAVAVGDVDSDGDPDLVIANRRSDTVTVLYNEGQGQFDEEATFSAGSTPMALVLADLDNDSDPDLAITNWMADRVTTLWNDGTGAFFPKALEHCVIAGACHLEGTCSPASSCLICDPSQSRSDWSWNPNCFEDNCASAAEVSLGTNYGSNDGFGPDLVEASCEPDSGHDAWYRYVAPCSARHVVSTAGSVLLPASDTVLTLYTECGGAELACDDDGGPGLLSRVRFDAEAGVTYYIRVAGAGDNVGDIVLTIDTLERCVQQHVRIDPLEPVFKRTR